MKRSGVVVQKAPQKEDEGDAVVALNALAADLSAMDIQAGKQGCGSPAFCIRD